MHASTTQSLSRADDAAAKLMLVAPSPVVVIVTVDMVCAASYAGDTQILLCRRFPLQVGHDRDEFCKLVMTGMSSVRYGTRLGDLKENWFLLFSN